ncbi:MAG: prolipoprotein diacylglyceryl transferase family protein [Terracidiphilus sp.]
MYPVLIHIGPFVIPSYGAMAALGVLLALGLVLRTARIVGVNPNQLWNLCIIALSAALVGSRLLLVIVNWTVVRSHPAWLLSLAMIHHPLLTAAGAFFAAVAAALFAHWRQMPFGSTADAIAPPLALGLALDQIGALMAGSGCGTETAVRWAVVYTDPLAARWSGAPLGVPVHPVQAYAALAFFTISISLLVWMPFRRQQGDVAGFFLFATGAAVYFTEFWRDPEGRGVILHGALDGPQVAAIALVLAGAWVLRRRDSARIFKESATSSAENVIHSRHANESPHD